MDYESARRAEVCDELNGLYVPFLNEQAVQKPRTVVMFHVL